MMTRWASVLEAEGYLLRSGGADGADIAFENGVILNVNKEIYLPWPYFNKNSSIFNRPTPEAEELSGQYHRYWDKLKNSVKKLMARNAHQVLGEDLVTPSFFVLCWTKDGCETHYSRTPSTGGTGQAISIASLNGIPVINMRNKDWESRLEELLRSIKENSIDCT